MGREKPSGLQSVGSQKRTQLATPSLLCHCIHVRTALHGYSNSTINLCLSKGSVVTESCFRVNFHRNLFLSFSYAYVNRADQ